MTTVKHRDEFKVKPIRKGKYASSTENRRLVWEFIIWPSILDLNKSYFTPQEYHIRRDKTSRKKHTHFKDGWRDGITIG